MDMFTVQLVFTSSQSLNFLFLFFWIALMRNISKDRHQNLFLQNNKINQADNLAEHLVCQKCNTKY